jgi:hypothetical protein
MSATYEIVEARRQHVIMMRDKLREGDIAEIEATGHTPAHALWRSYRASLMRKTVFVDGEIGAMWGCSGSALSGYGSPWLLTTHAIERIPFGFVREARAEVALMREVFPVLQNYVPVSYRKACGLLRILGFRLDTPRPMGPHGVLFHRFVLE